MWGYRKSFPESEIKMTDTPTPVATLKVEIDIPMERVVNCIVGFCESPYSPWAQSFLPPEKCESLIENTREVEKGIWYSTETYWTAGGLASLTYDDPSEPEGTFGASKTIGKPELVAGLTAMAQKAPRHFADLVNENDDAITHDVFMQMVVFGEIIYG
jgi:hypothetical protein